MQATAQSRQLAASPPKALPSWAASPSLTGHFLPGRMGPDLPLAWPARPIPIDRALTLDGIMRSPVNSQALDRLQDWLASGREGSAFCLVGPSGVGKSYILNAARATFESRRPSQVTDCLLVPDLDHELAMVGLGQSREAWMKLVTSAHLLCLDGLEYAAQNPDRLLAVREIVTLAQKRGCRVLATVQSYAGARAEFAEEDPLRAFFKGVVVGILRPPDFELRRKLIASIARSQCVQFSDQALDALSVVSERSQIGELRGIVTCIIAVRHEFCWDKSSRPIIECEEAFRALLVSGGEIESEAAQNDRLRRVLPADVALAVCEEFQCGRAQLQESFKRCGQLSLARAMLVFVAREIVSPKPSLPELAESVLGFKSHTSCISALHSVTTEGVEGARMIRADLAPKAERIKRRAVEISGGFVGRYWRRRMFDHYRGVRRVSLA